MCARLRIRLRSSTTASGPGTCQGAYIKQDPGKVCVVLLSTRASPLLRIDTNRAGHALRLPLQVYPSPYFRCNFLFKSTTILSYACAVEFNGCHWIAASLVAGKRNLQIADIIYFDQSRHRQKRKMSAMRVRAHRSSRLVLFSLLSTSFATVCCSGLDILLYWPSTSRDLLNI